MNENIARVKNLLISSLRGEAEAIHKNDKICHFDRIFFCHSGHFFLCHFEGAKRPKNPNKPKEYQKEIARIF